MATVAATQTPFTWEGTDRTGKKVKGKVVAASEAAVRSELRRQGVVPSRVKKQSVLFRKQGKVTPVSEAVGAGGKLVLRPLPGLPVIRDPLSIVPFLLFRSVTDQPSSMRSISRCRRDRLASSG